MKSGAQRSESRAQGVTIIENGKVSFFIWVHKLALS